MAIIGEYVQVAHAIIRLAPIPAVLDIRNDQGQTPMHLAVLTNQSEIVRRLMLAGAKVSTCIFFYQKRTTNNNTKSNNIF